MPENIHALVALTAKRHRLPVNPELFARCEYELERSAQDDKSVIAALLRALREHESLYGLLPAPAKWLDPLRIAA